MSTSGGRAFDSVGSRRIHTQVLLCCKRSISWWLRRSITQERHLRTSVAVAEGTTYDLSFLPEAKSCGGTVRVGWFACRNSHGLAVVPASTTALRIGILDTFVSSVTNAEESVHAKPGGLRSAHFPIRTRWGKTLPRYALSVRSKVPDRPRTAMIIVCLFVVVALSSGEIV